jgi:hypothetical protein
MPNRLHGVISQKTVISLNAICLVLSNLSSFTFKCVPQDFTLAHAAADHFYPLRNKGKIITVLCILIINILSDCVTFFLWESGLFILYSDGLQSSIPGSYTTFVLLHSVQTVTGVQAASYLMGTGM